MKPPRVDLDTTLRNAQPDPVTLTADPTDRNCLICREHSGDVDVPGGLLDDGLVITFHRPPLHEATTVYAGHLLITPKRHAPDFASLTQQEAGAIGVAISTYSGALSRLGASRVYVATIGHGVDHLHVHLLPRWPNTPDAVAWHCVDQWDGARHLSPREIEELVADLRP